VVPAGPGTSLTRGLCGTNKSPGSAGDRAPFSSTVVAYDRGHVGLTGKSPLAAL